MINRLAVVDQHAHFYKKNYRRIVALSFVLIGILFCIMGVIIYQEYTRPTEKYFITTSDGRLIEIKPLQE
jgi:hypothetical protein